MIGDIADAVRAYRKLSLLGKRLFRLETRLEVKPRVRKKGSGKGPGVNKLGAAPAKKKTEEAFPAKKTEEAFPAA